ncbi:MAG: TIGR04283 family arsenosugar biosynthesis glycosyltransferase [Janthinobacterium lividum]
MSYYPAAAMLPTPLLSVIIPTLNEAEVLARTLTHVASHIGPGITYEVLVCDGGSTDGTTAAAEAHQARVLRAAVRGRAAQLNLGARHASGEILYFLHADTLPPPGFGQLIRQYHQRGYPAGCFRLTFPVRHWILRTSSWASRFNAPNFQFGDQSLYVQRTVFQHFGPYDESLLLMEDVELVTRLKRHVRFALLPFSVVTSARKYLAYGIVRTELTHLVVHTLYVLGTRQRTIAKVYKNLLRQRRQPLV